VSFSGTQRLTQERTVSKCLWPPRSPDLSTCDFYLWGYLKGKVYESNPHTLDELRKNIRSTIKFTVLPKVYLNVIKRAKNVLIHKDLICNIFCNSVHLAYQKLRKQNPFLFSPYKRAGLKWNTLYIYQQQDDNEICSAHTNTDQLNSINRLFCVRNMSWEINIYILTALNKHRKWPCHG
jgi:hypothetical protein